MKDNYVSVVFVVDESGSMAFAKNDVINGFNEFLSEQRKEKKGDVDVSFYKFSSNGLDNKIYTMVNINDVKDITEKDYDPRGLTALNDALCTAIDEIGAILSSKDESERPSQVIFVVMTDGYENNSIKFTREDVRKRIEHQESKYSWTFLYMGANMNDASEAKHMGFNKIAFNDYKDTQDSYEVVSQAVLTCRNLSVPRQMAKVTCDSFIDAKFNEMNKKYEKENNVKIKNL